MLKKHINKIIFFSVMLLLIVALVGGMMVGAQDKKEDKHNICMEGCYHMLEETGLISEAVSVRSFGMKEMYLNKLCNDHCSKKYPEE